MTKRNYDAIDIMKLILSFMVAAIHIGVPYYTYIFPWVRIAVPLFFITSGYFLFGKMSDKSYNEQIHILKRFLIRNIKLYAIWFIVLSPITFMTKDYFGKGIIFGIRKLVISFFFTDTFYASWYISALMIGAVIVFFLSRSIGKWTLMVGGGIIYHMLSYIQLRRHIQCDNTVQANSYVLSGSHKSKLSGVNSVDIHRQAFCR